MNKILPHFNRSEEHDLKTSESLNRLWVYFGLTYLFMSATWGLMAILHISGASVVSTNDHSSSIGLVMLMLGGFSPTISAVILILLYEGPAGISDLWKRIRKVGIGTRWYMAILLLPVLLAVVRLAVYIASGGELVQSPLLSDPLKLFAFTVPLLLIGPISEEAGWRGFALEHMLFRWNLLKASLILGIVWGVWHLPLFFIAGTIQQIHGNFAIEFPIFVLQVLGLSVFFNWIYANTRSLFATMLVHFVFNWLYSFSATFMKSGTGDRLANAILYSVLAIIILIFWSSGNKPIHNQEP